MEERVKLSIIVPVYNMASAGLLQFCMESLLSQTVSDYEIIAIDNKSTDRSLEILRKFENDNPGKVVVIESGKNRGQGGAANRGLLAAKGEWIGFVNGDDWVTKDYYEKLLAKADETGADVVGCNRTVTEKLSFEAGEVIKNDFLNLTGELTEEDYAKLILNPGDRVAKIFRREIFSDNGLWFPEDMYYPDYCISPLAMLCCRHFEYVDEPNYFSCKKPENVSIQKCEDGMTAMIYFIEECIKREYLSEYPEEIEYRFTEVFYINTLFSFMHGMPFYKKHLSFLYTLRDGILSCFPDFMENPYYLKNTDDETKRLLTLHMKSPLRFYWYYEALMTNRKLFRRKAK